MLKFELVVVACVQQNPALATADVVVGFLGDHLRLDFVGVLLNAGYRVRVGKTLVFANGDVELGPIPGPRRGGLIESHCLPVVGSMFTAGLVLHVDLSKNVFNGAGSTTNLGD